MELYSFTTSNESATRRFIFEGIFESGSRIRNCETGNLQFSLYEYFQVSFASDRAAFITRARVRSFSIARRLIAGHDDARCVLRPFLLAS